ncbi:MAG: spore germination protein [Paenibacillaceae bacterium]|nr:spore germination protein [Paenibacillaceae bacterium]
MEKISLYQLAAMVILFQIGSSPLFLLASEAKQDAWIAVLVALLCGGMLLYFVTLAIQRQEPGKNLIEIMYQYFGRFFTQLFAWPYVIYFVYKSVRNVREFGDLMIEYLLPQSPLPVITAILMLVSAYAVYMGVEVFFRMAEVLLPIVAVMYFLLMMMALADGLIHLNKVLPILADGIKPVLSAALPEVISFPFGEMVLFLMFWKYANTREGIARTTLVSYFMAGIFLVFTNALIVFILGPVLATAGGIPLLLIASFIQIGNVVERMDPFVGILLFTGVMIKQTAYYMGAVLALASIFNKSRRFMLAPAGVAIYIGALLFQSFMQQIRVGFEYNVKYHFPVFQIAIPALLLLVMKIKGGQQQNLKGGASNGTHGEEAEPSAAGAGRQEQSTS